jgi:tetratricopeptide (TPR) repeat protein
MDQVRAQVAAKLEAYDDGECDLVDVLRLLPLETETEHAYEVVLGDIALKKDRVRLRKELKTAVNDPDDGVALAAFYCGTIFLRRMKDFTDLKDWIESHRPKFYTHPAFDHAWVMWQLERGDVDVEQSLRRSHKLAKKFPRNPGFLHLYADVVATAGELSREDETNTSPADLDSALKSVQKAIELYPYAKCYATKARLLALKDNFRDALACIETAIDQEDSSHSDYAIRIGNYQFHRLRIQSWQNDRRLRARIEEYSAKQAAAERKLEEADGKLTNAERKIDDLVGKLTNAERKLDDLVGRLDDSIFRNLSFLGFFAALVALTIGSLQFAATTVEPEKAAKLIIVLMGALLVAFSGFSFILERRFESRTWRVLLMGALGMLASVGGAYVWFR